MNVNAKGMTLVEIIVVTAIIAVIGIAIAGFQRDVFFLNSTTQNNLSAQMDGRRVLRMIVGDLRGANRSSLGAYPIATAGTSSLVFYTNVDSDQYFERVRYYIQGKELKRGLIKPSGNPLTYNTSQETTETLMRDIINATSSPLFEYFPSTYAGTSTPLSQPVNTALIRLVRISIVIDKDIHRPPSAITVRTQAMLRNLKDNQ